MKQATPATSGVTFVWKYTRRLRFKSGLGPFEVIVIDDVRLPRAN